MNTRDQFNILYDNYGHTENISWPDWIGHTNSDKQGAGRLLGACHDFAYGNRYRQKNRKLSVFPSWVAHQHQARTLSYHIVPVSFGLGRFAVCIKRRVKAPS